MFSSIIESEKIDFDLKVSAIGRNVNLMIETVLNPKSYEEIEIVIKAMRLHPIIQVGEALKEAVDNKTILATDEIIEVIKYIEEMGVEGVNKYEK